MTTKPQPIETVPKDGTQVMIGRYEAPGNQPGQWWWATSGEFEEGEFFSTADDEVLDLDFFHTATHWWPMPPDPED